MPVPLAWPALRLHRQSLSAATHILRAGLFAKILNTLLQNARQGASKFTQEMSTPQVDAMVRQLVSRRCPQTWLSRTCKPLDTQHYLYAHLQHLVILSPVTLYGLSLSAVCHPLQHMLDGCFDSPWLSTLDEFDLSWLPEELLSPSTTGAHDMKAPTSTHTTDPLHPVLYVLSSLGTAVLVIKRNVRPTYQHPGRRSSDSSEQTCEPLSGAACKTHSTRASSSSATSSSHSYSPSQLSSQQQLLLCSHNDAQDCTKQTVSGDVVTLPSSNNPLSLLNPVLPWQAHRHQLCHSPAVLPPLPVGGGHGMTAAAGVHTKSGAGGRAAAGAAPSPAGGAQAGQGSGCTATCPTRCQAGASSPLVCSVSCMSHVMCEIRSCSIHHATGPGGNHWRGKQQPTDMQQLRCWRITLEVWLAPCTTTSPGAFTR
ncbi:hypothetical protein HaLaN_31695 [Haematococcus lacustris]|uniref:Uncharacterized protein n=1 Tax=Haematococcus lacustris TaxID=44745 RepID=A0A6A0AIN5_HAELA|nr:hypothetical protein HaLaN_31695 [Haematococcus lacustris]